MLNDLVKRTEDAGVAVYFLNRPKCDGVVVSAVANLDWLHPNICIAYRFTQASKVIIGSFILLHEVAHITAMYGCSRDLNDNDEEALADAVATVIMKDLVPGFNKGMLPRVAYYPLDLTNDPLLVDVCRAVAKVREMLKL